MDVAISPSRWSRWKLAAIGAAIVVCAAAAVIWLAPGFATSAQSVPADRVTISPVASGLFEDFIPLRGTAAPLDTIFLDAVEGGRVSQKLVEDGAMVSVGQPLAVLTNSALRLEVIRSESEVTNQLNTLRSIEIQLNRTRADNERAVNEVRWQLKRINQKAERDQALAAVGFVGPAALQDSKDEDAYWRNRLEITERSQRSDEELQNTQLVQLRTATRQLEANLALARENLDALVVRAPVAGRLTAFEINPGQSLTRGQRLGQIDSPDAAKLLVSIDEFYLNRVAMGAAASLESNGKTHPMTVRKINPQVRAGQFEAELVYSGAPPDGLRRGQTLQAKLALGESKQSLLLPAGAFLADGGGHFVFVVNEGTAEKRAVQLGRRNVNVVEVVSGLRAGEQVITSSYSGFFDKEKLTISK